MKSKLTYLQFGRQLLDTGDLDPIYIMLCKSRMDLNLLKRWCLAYWCFYHAGVASAIAEAPPSSFWKMMKKADQDKWPRGKERRHFRAANSANALDSMSASSPTAIVDKMISGDTFKELSKNVTSFPQFGSWMAFKIADMREQVFGVETNFPDLHLGIYKDPRQGAALIATGDWRSHIGISQVKEVVDKLIKDFRKYDAPPFYRRKVNVMEVETILCKYKSHVKGHYPLLNDCRDIYEGLEGWGQLAEDLRCLVPSQDKL